MFSKRTLTSVAGILAVAALAGTALGAARSNSVTYADPAGDSGNAPDVTGVTVSNDDSGKITFAISVPNRAQLGPADLLVMALETDGNLSNGVSGVDYGLVTTGLGSVLLSAQTGSFAPVAGATLTSSFVAGVETISLNRSDLGGTSMVNFVILASGDDGDTTGDFAPNDTLWSFPVVIAPPPPPPPPPPPAASRPPATAPASLSAGNARKGTARAGKPFTASLTVKQAGRPVNGKVACRASVAGKTLRPVASRGAGAGVAACTWLVPESAAGKTLKGTITVSSKGASVSRSFSTRVR